MTWLRRVAGRRMRAPNYRLLLIVMVAWPLGVLVVWRLHAPPGASPAPFVLHHPYFHYNVSAEEPHEPQQWCQLPRYHPFDPSILVHLPEPRDHIHCRQRQPDLTWVDTNGTLRLNATLTEKYSNLACTYQELFRITDDQNGFRDEKILPLEGAPLQEDFVFVNCRNVLGMPIYSNLHAHPREVGHPPLTCPQCPKYNVLIFVIDSLSRYGMIRLLPNTYSYLKHNLSAVVFRGFTKIADNTYPNLGALLTGLNIYGNRLSHLAYDDWPLIWKNFSQAGYVTFFGEDFPKFGLFNYPTSGLVKQPTDFYMRPFWLALEASSLYKMSSHMCFGNTPKHLLHLDYLKRFLTKYRNIPFFAFSMLSELTHEYISLITAADDDIMNFFKFLKEENFLDNTVLLVMGDHGPRYGTILQTKMGRVEERLPMFSLVIPEKLFNEPHNIGSSVEQNKGRLTSHYDTYATLVDLLMLARQPGHQLGSVSLHPGRSLFAPISLNRTCAEAGVPPHYCVCDEEVALSTEGEAVRAAGQRVVDRINDLLAQNLSPPNPCADLTLLRIHSGYKLLEFGETTAKLRVVVETEPGNALFEATLQDNEVLEDIGRLNRYNNQSICIHHQVLRKFCYCKNS